MMKTSDIVTFFNRYREKRSLSYGLPFILFCILGSFGFKQVTEIRYKYGQVKSIREEAIAEGQTLKKVEEVTIEYEYEKLKEINLDEWENKRIERPWEQ